MSDDQPPQPPRTPPRPVRKRPANVNQRADIRARPKAKPPQSKESRFVGYLVLGFGLITLIAVGFIAFGNGGNKDGERAATATATAQDPDYNFGKAAPVQPPPAPTNLNNRAARDLATTLAPVRPPAPQPTRVVTTPRQPFLDADAIEGTWQGVIGKYTAVLKIGDGRYQVVLADPYEYGYRPYSAGTYNKLEDILTLTPQTRWPTPASPPGVSINYSTITTAPFPVIAAIAGNRMLWRNPPRTEKRVIVPNTMPLLVGEDQDYIVWDKLPSR